MTNDEVCILPQKPLSTGHLGVFAVDGGCNRHHQNNSTVLAYRNQTRRINSRKIYCPTDLPECRMLFRKSTSRTLQLYRISFVPCSVLSLLLNLEIVSFYCLNIYEIPRVKGSSSICRGADIMEASMGWYDNDLGQRQW